MSDFFQHVHDALFGNNTVVSLLSETAIGRIPHYESALNAHPQIGILQTYCADAVDSNGTTARNAKKAFLGGLYASPPRTCTSAPRLDAAC